MLNYNAIRDAFTSDDEQKDLFDKLTEFYGGENDAIDAILNDDAEDAIDEIADSSVNCYTSARFEWLDENWNDAEAALADYIDNCGRDGLPSSFDGLIGIAWYWHNQTTMRSTLEDLKSAAESVEELPDEE